MESNRTPSPTGSMSLHRRTFLARAGAAAAFTIVPSSVLARAGQSPPSERVHVGIIGAGGQGLVNTKQLLQFADVQVVAVADPSLTSDYSKFYFGGTAGREPARRVVDDYYGKQKPAGQYQGCTAYVDFREMLEKEDLDACLVATTDNWHAPASMAAMRKGKHVYCEKPLAKTVHEAWTLAQGAKQYQRATQTGNQGQATEDHRLTCEILWDGAIGDVREVHAWTDRPFSSWQQGIDRPKDTPPLPPGLDWDKWLGPAPERPYHPAYHPYKWRGWSDFGTGAMGDAAAHSLFTVFAALKLTYPTTVQATSTGFNGETLPAASIVYYEFPARGSLPPLRLTWYDGYLQPPRPPELDEGRQMRYNSVIYVGDKGKMLDGRLLPESRMKDYKLPPKTLPRSPGHHREWINACKGQGTTGASFDITGPMTEVMAMGNLALRFPGVLLRWDAASRSFTNHPEANKYLHRPYREGWVL